MDYLLLFSCLAFVVVLYLGDKFRANRLVLTNGDIVYSDGIHLFHVAGILLLGLLPFLFDKPFSDNFQFRTLPLIVISILCCVAAAVGMASARKNKGNQIVYSSRIDSFALYATVYIVLRVLYIVAYELFFRGFLLTDSIQRFDTATAISINVLLYALLHLVNGKKEALACIPFGLILCLLVLWTRSAWVAVIIHLCLTLSHDLTVLGLRKKS